MLRDVRCNPPRGLGGDRVQGLLRGAFAAVAENLKPENGEENEREDTAGGDQGRKQEGHAPASHRATSQSGSVSSVS